jgi:hypothetical protein
VVVGAGSITDHVVNLTPPSALQLTSTRSPFGTTSSSCSQIIPTTPGAVYNLSAWGMGLGDADLGYHVTEGVTTLLAVNFPPPGFDDWHRLDAGPFVGSGASVLVVFSCPTPPSGGGSIKSATYVLDNAFCGTGEIPYLARSRWDAFSAVITLLKTINGGPNFHTDLQSRVYPRFVDPRRNGGVFPYVCVPLSADLPVITNYERKRKIPRSGPTRSGTRCTCKRT